MPKYLVQKKIRFETQKQLVDYFDIGDQVKWDSLMELAAKFVNPKQLVTIPKVAPTDFQVWLALYKMLPDSCYPTENEEFSNQSNQWQILNNEGDADYSENDPYVDLTEED